MGNYGTAEHEAWLIERERDDDSTPWGGTPTRAELIEAQGGGCGCMVSMVYGGDCAHTAAAEFADDAAAWTEAEARAAWGDR